MTRGWGRGAAALVLALVCATAAATSVAHDLEVLRYPVVAWARPATAPSLALDLPDLAAFRGRRAALILGVNGGASPQELTVDLDGRAIGRLAVPAGGDVRYDTSFLPPSGTGHRLTITGQETGWSLSRLEIATVHWHVRGPLAVFVVPDDPEAGRAASPLVFVTALAALLLLRPRVHWPRPLGLRRVYHVLAGATFIGLVAVVASPVFTDYSVLLSGPTLLLAVAVLYVNAELAGSAWRSRSAVEGQPDVGASALTARELAVALGGFIALVAVVFHEQVFAMYSVPDLGDPLFSIWRMAWVRHQIVADPAHLFDANIFYPARGTLTYSDAMILPALAGAPLRAAGLHPVLAYNVLLLSAFVACGVSVYVLARGLGLAATGAWTAGAVFALSSFRIDHYSHLELQMAMWMPLALLAVHRLLATGRVRYLALAALAIGAQWYSSMYYAVFLSVYAAVFASVLALASRGWRRLAQAAVAVALGAALAAPLAVVYSRWQGERGERPRASVVEFSATPADYLRPTARSAVYGRRGPAGYPERELFPGLVPLALAVAGAWPPVGATRLALIVAGWVAFDGSLGLNGHWYPFAYEWSSVFRSIRVPARFAVLVSLTLAVLAGFGIERVRRSVRARAPAGVWLAAATLAVTIEGWPAVHLVPAWREPPDIYSTLGPSSGAVLLEYPINPVAHYFDENIPYVYFSAWHMTPMVNGYSGTITLRYADTAAALNDFPGGDTLPYLRRLGVTHVSVNCAISGRLGPRNVPVPDPEKCARIIERLDAEPDLRRVVTTRWQDAPAILYELVR